MSKPVCDDCGLCCRGLIVEIEHLDIVREPRLAPPTSRLLDGGGSIEYESEWDKVYQLACGSIVPCPMHDPIAKRCTIYPTRPNTCVGFDAGSDQCLDLRDRAGLCPLPSSPDPS